MAQQQRRQVEEIEFKQLQLFKDETLGVGSYGSVCKARYDDLLCAAKIIHPTLFDPIAQQQIEPRLEHRLPFQRFVQECEFLKAIRHPNIVQYLGVEQDPETRLPVLLMELMDDSLTHFLEASQGPVPYHIQLNLCHDITLALSFLHSNAIIHRDLSGKNVLLIGDIRAKVTDFGMAKLGDMNPQATRISNTMCPGTDVYMPPEAVKDKPEYTEKMDSFSFGVIAIQMLTHEFPKPGNRQKTIQIDHPQFPTVHVDVPEVERRQNHISKIDPNHPLLLIALDCLKDKDVERPSAQELCHRLAALKETPRYCDSVRMARERGTQEQDRAAEQERQIRELRQQREEQETQIAEQQKQIDEQETQITELKQQNYVYQQEINELDIVCSHILEDYQQEIKAQNTFCRERELQHVQQIQNLQQQKNAIISAKEKINEELTQQNRERLLRIDELEHECTLAQAQLSSEREQHVKHIQKIENLQHQCIEKDKLITAEREVNEMLRRQTEDTIQTERAKNSTELQHSKEYVTIFQKRVQELEQQCYELIKGKNEVVAAEQLALSKLRLQLEDVRQEVKQKDLVISEREKELQLLKQQLESREEMASSFQKQFDKSFKQPEVCVPDVNQDSPWKPQRATTRQRRTLPWNKKVSRLRAESTPDRVQELAQGSVTVKAVHQKTEIKLKWKKAESAPCKMHRGTCAVSGNMIYFNSRDSIELYAYNSTHNNWSQLPNALYWNASIAVVNGYLTTIGGVNDFNEFTNQLHSFDNSDVSWVEMFPQMPIPQCYAIAVCNGTALIVAGGYTISSPLSSPLTKIQVMDIATLEWSDVLSPSHDHLELPLELQSYSGSFTICGDKVFVADSSSMFTCSLSALLESSSYPMWTPVADLPFKYSTLVSLNNQLLAIGGFMDNKNKQEVSVYNPTTNRWRVISRIIQGRHLCLAAVLPTNELMIVGGFSTVRSKDGPATDTTEIATSL